MSDYRDERRALRQRVEALEEAAQDKDAEIERLRGELARARDGEPPPEPQPSIELAPAPRALRPALAIPQVLCGSVAWVAIAGSVVGFALAGWASLEAREWLALAIASLPALLTGLVVRRRLRVLRLLRDGVAAPAVFVTRKLTGAYTEPSSQQQPCGWDVKGTMYTGPVYKSRLRLGLAEGPHAEITVSGMEYDGGMFVFDPARPRHHVAPQLLPLPLRPDERGQWRPLRFNEASARELCERGKELEAGEVLGPDPRPWAWIVAAVSGLLLLGPLALVLMAIAGLAG